MRAIERGDVPTDALGQPKQYKQYENAQPDLMERLGEYCSYCERFIPTNLAVEHIQSKDNKCQPQLERSWNNFLLACTNCNSAKGTKVCDDTTQSYYYWPHLDNTFRAFVYKAGGIIKINPALNAAEQAQRTLELTGLDKHPNTSTKPTPKDKRWNHRRLAWKFAQDTKMSDCNFFC
ncbi:MAG: HNH endonuclease [Candidatus Parabeggiatoa sp. nov. 1]|nr:MAG: HNH endonuclease [Gammaproteobacteria bacterium]